MYLKKLELFLTKTRTNCRPAGGNPTRRLAARLLNGKISCEGVAESNNISITKLDEVDKTAEVI